MSRPKVQHKRVRHTGFTLVEVLIAVGAVSLIAIGLAKVFSSTGETVRAGRRLSNLNEYASLIERQLRDDVASMTRDGFLVIRHRNTADNTNLVAVRLDPQQELQYARPRRVDELMFFASGRFSTLRDPIHPARVPTGTAARIYYGHALRDGSAGGPPDPTQYSSPTVNDQSPFGASGGANEFAGDWILQRQVTVLADPVATDESPLAGTVSGVTANEVPDNDIQVGLQPAASSIFKTLALGGPVPMPTDAQLVRDNDLNPQPWPHFSSGIIDLATTNLSEVRQIILDAQPYPLAESQWDPDADVSVDGAGNRFAFQRDAAAGAINNTFTSVTSNMKRWMIGALPAGWPRAENLAADRRMRAELTPPNLLGVAGGGAPWPNNEPWHRADQMMLAASNFVPHCTEFIVEWSFGQVERDSANAAFGELRWYGLWRRADPTNPQSRLVATPYNRIINNNTYYQRVPLQSGPPLARPVNPALVHFPPLITPTLPPDYAPFYSCFGYLDPTYPDAGFEADAAQRYPATIPWAWPKLLRITISLVDPTDPLREQTFQFIIEVPEAKVDRF